MGADGRPAPPQERSSEAWDLYLSALERRMQDGETLIFDATHPRASDLRPEDADRILAYARDGLSYVWRGRRVLCAHAGLPALPDRLSFVLLVSAAAPAGWIQLHGPRNHRGLPVRAGQRSFNLEGQVEFGGHLRALTLDEAALHAHEIHNPVFLPVAEQIAQEQAGRGRRQIRPPTASPAALGRRSGRAGGADRSRPVRSAPPPSAHPGAALQGASAHLLPELHQGGLLDRGLGPPHQPRLRPLRRR